MGKMVIHKSIFGHIKIDGTRIDDKVKELEIESGIYDVVGGLDYDPRYNTASDAQGGGKFRTIWGFHEKVKIDEQSICHVYVKRKFSLLHIIPIIKVKYQ